MGGKCSTCGRGELHTGFWWKNLWKKEHSEDSGADWRVILKWIFRKCVGIDCIDLAQDKWVAGPCKRGNERSRSIKRGDFLSR